MIQSSALKLMDWEHLPTIEASRVILRRMVEEDVEALYTIFSDPQVMQYWSTTPLADRTATTALLKEIDDGFQRRTS